MDIKERIARLLSGGNTFGGNRFGGNTFGGATFGGNQFGASASPMPTPPVSVRATPPPLPQFQIPGMNSLPGFNPQAQPAPPPMAPSMPPAPQAPAPMQPASVPPLPPAVNIGVAPGMGNQSGNQLDEWRRALDAAQWARQGQ